MRFNEQLIDLPTLYHVIDRCPLTISYDSYVVDAINLMTQERSNKLPLTSCNLLLDASRWNHQDTSCVLVMEQGHLLGILTEQDIVRLTASKTDLSQTKMAEVMTQQFISLKPSDFQNIFTALSILRHHQIRHLPILDDGGELLGIVTENSLLQGFDLLNRSGVIEALQQPQDELRQVNQPIETVSSMTRNYIKRWVEEQSSGLLQGDEELHQTLVELQIVEEELRQATQRKQAEQKIREQVALLDIVADAIYLRDLQDQILFWNQGAERIYGWQTEEAIGKNATELLHKKNLSQFIEEAFKTVIESGSWQGELRKVQKSGGEIIVQSRWTLMRDGGGQPKSILTVDTDITQKKQLEQQFLRAQRLESLGTLAGGISHDLNNILTPILAAAQLLQGKFSQDQEGNQYLLQIIENNTKRGAALVKQVQSFARVVRGEHTIVQLKHLITEISMVVKQTFPKSIKFTADIPEQLWAISGDVTQLHQVLMNLLINARDAMPEGGVITISAENMLIDETYGSMNLEAKVGDYVVMTIADTGSGMSPEILDRIFEPFFTTKEMSGATGLGLSTALRIIKSHGGFVNVSSRVDKSSQFKIFLPAVEATPSMTTEDMGMLVGNGELILVVDDEDPIREVAKFILETHNYMTLTASNGIEAIALYAQHKHCISAVFMDMMMPEMDGVTAIRTLQKMNPQVQIIAWSGLTSAESLAQAARTGVQLVLPKPFSAKELLYNLHCVLSQRN